MSETSFLHSMIAYITDHKKHDLRYVIDFTKLKTEFGWEPNL